MDITFLGTGNARGIPTFGCECPICARARRTSEGLRHCPSHLVSAGDEAFVLDAGRFDLHRQMEGNRIDSVVLSHFHPDHVYGLFLISWGRDRSITVHAPPDENGYADLLEDPGILEFEHVTPFQAFALGSFSITPLPLNHSILTYGYAIEHHDSRLAYLMDTCGLPEESRDFLSDWNPDVAIIDCNQAPGNPKRSHNTPEQAIQIHRSIGAERSILSHLSCAVCQWLASEAKLPADVQPAHDGLVVSLP